jgi:hypothetical protein
MPTDADHPALSDPNYQAYRRLKVDIDRSYPIGHFVAIVDGRITADAARFDELDRMLEALGLAPEDTFVVQAGVDHPQSGTILLSLGR